MNEAARLLLTAGNKWLHPNNHVELHVESQINAFDKLFARWFGTHRMLDELSDSDSYILLQCKVLFYSGVEGSFLWNLGFL